MLAPFLKFRLRRLDSQGFDYKLRHGPAGILLLSCDQVAVTHGVRFETTRYDEVGSGKLLRFILDPERLNSLANKVVGIALFGISKAGPGLPVNYQLVIYPCLEKNAGRMAQDRRHFSSLV